MGGVMNKLILLFSCLLLTACSTPRGLRPEDVPTAASIEMLSTALPLTQNAPPAPFNRPQTAYAQIDALLNELEGWRYTVQLEFNGTFAGTPRTTEASASAEVSFNQLAAARRVLVSTTGELIGAGEGSAYEAVRLGPDTFLVRGGACLVGARGDATAAADLRAGDLVGGVRTASPAGRRAVINDAEVYAYSFTADDLVLPAIRPAAGGSIVLESGELWIAPQHRAVVRYYLNLTVNNVILFDRQLPVSGTVLLRYDLYDVGTPFNISVPFGC
jgi:predicted small secreted protein